MTTWGRGGLGVREGGGEGVVAARAHLPVPAVVQHRLAELDELGLVDRPGPVRVDPRKLPLELVARPVDAGGGDGRAELSLADRGLVELREGLLVVPGGIEVLGVHGHAGRALVKRGTGLQLVAPQEEQPGLQHLLDAGDGLVDSRAAVGLRGRGGLGGEDNKMVGAAAATSPFALNSFARGLLTSTAKAKAFAVSMGHRSGLSMKATSSTWRS